MILTLASYEMPASINFSYAEPTDPKLRQFAIRGIEQLTGQPHLRRIYNEYANNPDRDEDFISAAVRLLRLHVDHDRTQLENVPKSGPLVVVANHPFGVVDGVVIGHLISAVRRDYKIIAHGLLTRAPEAAERILPIDFSESEWALETNLRSRKQALSWLKDGHVLVVFPAGSVSTAKRPFGKAHDERWKPFTAKLIHSARAPVLPLFFSGQNSRLFQIVSRFSQTLRISLLFNEVHNKIGATINVTIGDPIPYERSGMIRDRQALIDHIQDLTYALAPYPCHRFTA